MPEPSNRAPTTPPVNNSSAQTAAWSLLYAYDPLCGWCYGAAPLLQALHKTESLTLHLYGGGLLSGARRRPITAQWREYVSGHDQRIAQLSGQPFGTAYTEGLLRREGLMMDSSPPITAVLVATELAQAGWTMLKRLQEAHYLEGLHICDVQTLRHLAEDLGLDGDAFAQRFETLQGAATQEHLANSHALLAALQGQGYPTLALVHPDQKTVQKLDFGAWLGQPEAWRDHILGLMASAV